MESRGSFSQPALMRARVTSAAFSSGLSFRNTPTRVQDFKNLGSITAFCNQMLCI